MRFQTILIGVCLTMLFAAAPTATRAQVKKDRGDAVIEGVVLTADGKPLANARVFLQPSDGLPPHVAKTGPDGHFRFENMHQGLFDLRAQFQGAESDWHRNVSVKPSDDVSVTLKLKLKPPPAATPKPSA
ncbi:MAG TPA: carboxypeptidase-like regulatory domain-containing protein [Candidatus Acidoferrales bacterium]|jgi:hypothetical protein|nr:carboxypeptidase-like regulatory domain-containing protein [Candidatus Acidoferrales bacterium]